LPIPTWSVGQVLAAADVNSWFVPLFVSKPANTSRTSNVTLANDPDLVLPVAAGATYQFNGMLDYEADVTGDLRFTLVAPAASTLLFGFSGFTGADNATFNGGNASGGTGLIIGGGGAGVARSVFISGVLITTSTAGNLTLQWAQSVSSGTATIMHANSYLTARRVG
jgi:hypothetical protein